MPDMVFLAFLVVDGALAGAIYALVALAFVVVYKASRMINFALGERIMLGRRMVAAGMHAFGLGLGGALGFGCIGMVAVAMAFNRVVLRRLFSRSLLSLIMVTIGLGIFMHGSAALVFAGIPGGIARPLPLDPVVIQGVPVSPDKLVAAAIAGACIAALSWFFHGRRTGLALRAIARDRKSTRLNSSHSQISYAVFCLKKKNDEEMGALPRVATRNTHRACTHARTATY